MTSDLLSCKLRAILPIDAGLQTASITARKASAQEWHKQL